MFSNLGNIFSREPRHAEIIDARQEIRRHDPDQERKKSTKDDDNQPAGFDEEDNAIVSIQALHVFLENFLKSTEVSSKISQKQQSFYQGVPPEQEKTKQMRSSGRAAQAAHAYQHSAEASGKRTFSTSEQENSLNVAQSLGLGAEEVRTIHVLLEDLKALSSRKIEYLRIERSESFLQSIVDAVAKVKSKH